MMRNGCVGLLLFTLSLPAVAGESDWPQWGRQPSKNMVAGPMKLPLTFQAGQFIGATDKIDMATTENVRWIAKLGSQSYGNPTVADGRVYVGTNNDSPRDARFVGDRCVVYCFDEKSGEMLWMYNIPKMGTGKVSDWEFLGICSSPTVDGERVYFVNNLCEVVCVDARGMANGNDGMQDEAQYYAGKGKPAVELSPSDADVIWTLNMIDECGVFPHNITSSSVLVVGDHLWVSTSNGVDYGHVETPAPHAPCLLLVDKNTGELLGEEASGLSQRIFHGNWTSPGYLRTQGDEMCIFGGPDGWVYAFDPVPKNDEEGYSILQERWRFDANPPQYREKDGKVLKYATREGPSEVLGTPVEYGGRVYALIGQDPEHGEGVGNLVCIDPSGKGDVTATHAVWSFSGINRSISTPSIIDDLLFVADYSGFIYCLDANTGELLWKHDTMAHIWGSTLVADGRVFVGNEDGYLTVIPARRELDKESVVEIDMGSPMYSSPIAANGSLYMASHTHLFAFGDPGK